MAELDSLFSPIRIKNIEIPNRAVMPPMGTLLSNRDGTVSDALLAYMKRRAEGGVGLLISEVTAVHPTGPVSPYEIRIWDDTFIPGLKKLAEVMRSAGGKACLQLHHAGRESFYMLKKGQAVGPSALPSLIYGQAPREMTAGEIQEVISSFGAAAGRAKEAGFDAVEIHAAHGYLLAQFLSALSNQRNDEYGGSFKNRARFILETIREVRASTGPDYPVLLRVSAEEYIKNGYTVDDMLTVIPDFVEAGADVIHASIGTHGSPGGVTSAPPSFEAGFNVWRAKEIKKASGVPVIAVGRFNDPRPADEAIARKDADMAAFGRQLICDPEFLVKARQNRYEDIRKCIACNQGCIEREIFEAKPVRCAINPEAGQEAVYPRGPAETPRRVFIAGAGPAGLTAALEAKRLGHDVTVFEKEQQAGGNVLYASKAPYKEIYLDWIRWQIRQVEKAGIPIKTGTRLTAQMIEKEKPDAVILAAGGEKITPSIKGTELSHVSDAWQVLDGSAGPGRNALVVGGGLVGMETACFLASKGSSVTLLEQLESSPVPKFTSHGYTVHKYLKDHGCRMLFGTKLKEIKENSVAVITEGEKEEEIPGFDQVVLAVGMKPREDLKEELEKRGITYKAAGDVVEVRRIMEATEEGARAAWEL